MNAPNKQEKSAEGIWETPTLREIPISFEATSYSLADDEPLNR
jgi:coenzyme PQQ precursor peptide PqqA